MTEYPGSFPPPEDRFNHLPPPPPQQFALPPQIQRTGTNPMAVASLLLSVFGFFLCGVGTLVGPILGFVALNQIKNSGGYQTGRGLAIAGIVVGLAMLVGFVMIMLIGVITKE